MLYSRDMHKKVLQFLFSILVLLLFLASPRSAFAACDAIEGNLSVSPTSGTTNDTYVVTGRVRDCANVENANNDQPGGLQLAEDADNLRIPAIGISTNEQGEFSTEVRVTEPGEWKMQIVSAGVPIGGSNTISFTVSPGTALKCGDPVTLGSNACPKDCPATDVPGSDNQICGGAHTPTPEITNPPSPTLRLVAPPCVAKPDAEGKIKKCDRIRTSLGVEFETTPEKFVAFLFTFFLSLAGSILLAIIIYSGFQMMTSRGDQEKIKVARERITSAIVGFMFLIFSLVILEVIGVDILRIPGFCGSNDVECENISQPTPTSFPTPQTTPTTDTPNGRPR